MINTIRMWWARLTEQPVIWVEFAGQTMVRIAKPHPDGRRWTARVYGVEIKSTVSSLLEGYTGGWVIPPKVAPKSEAERLEEAMAECDRLLSRLGKTHEEFKRGDRA